MTKKHIIIVGAGLTGPVLAIYLARMGMTVSIYERGNDPRGATIEPGKSINITLAERGLQALDGIGLREHVKAAAVPVYGRCIHHRDGRLESQTYGNYGEALWSIGRFRLSQMLTEAAATEPGVSLHFGHRLSALEIGTDSSTARFFSHAAQAEVQVSGDTFIGADGANSTVRQQLQRRPRFEYTQHYASHANKELMVPAAAAAPWAEQRNAIHIWPRGQHMLISFPNLDGSTTCTLHMPYEGPVSYDTVRTDADIRALFAADFADVLPYVDRLEHHYATNPLIPMITVRCAPWSVGSQALLIGDAAHAIWPSYGQGANSGFEDCRTLRDCLREQPDVAAAFGQFEQRRKANTDAIAQLSEDHFYEIRDKAGDADFQLRKRLELKLNRANPGVYQTLYSLVSFSTTPFVEALARQQQFDAIIDQVLAHPETEHDLLISQFSQP